MQRSILNHDGFSAQAVPTAVGGYLYPAFYGKRPAGGVAPTAVLNTTFPVRNIDRQTAASLNGQIGGIHIQSGGIVGIGNRNGILAFQRDCCVALHHHRGSYVSILPGNIAGDGFIVCRSCHQGHCLLCSLAGREIRIFRRADRTVGIDRLLLTVGFADALHRSIPGRAGNKPAVLGIALLAGIPAGRPLCGRDVAAAIVMLAAFMRTA